MYLEQLRSFCAVVEHGSYTRAARQLHLTQPAVSQHVRSLEQTFRVPLLDRVGGRMVPTEAGQVLLQRGAEILAQMEAMQREIAALKGLSGGRVTVAASLTAGSYVLPQIIARFRRHFPEVQVVLHVDRAQEVYEQVLHGTLDFGVNVAHRPPPGVVTEPLYCERIVLVASPEHPVARASATPLPVYALARLPLLALGSASLTRQLCDQWLAGLGIRPPVEMEFDSIAAMKRVVAEGLGAALLSYSSVVPEVAAGQLRMIEVQAPPLYSQFVLARRAQQRFSPAARELLEALARDLTENPHITEVYPDAARRFIGRTSAPLSAP